jgi:hypothetical protein
MTKLKRLLLVIALGPLTLMGLSAHAQANAKGNDLSGDWKGTCTKVGTGSTWDVEIVIRDDDTYTWTSTFRPGTSGNPKGWTAGGPGRVDRTSGQLTDSNQKTGSPYSVDGNHMHVDTRNGMSQCSLTR